MAQTEVQTYGLVINPPISRVDLVPGSIIRGKVNVLNAFEQDKTITVKILLEDVFQQNGVPVVLPLGQSSGKYSMKDWLSTEITTFTLKHAESKDIDFAIRVPLRPVPGGKYGAVVFRVVPDTSSTNGQNAPIQGGDVLTQDLAHVIIGRVPGTEQEDSDILDFTVNKPLFLFWPNEDINFGLTIKNKGNVDMVPSGDIFVHQGDVTQSIKALRINEAGQTVLPENTRTFTIEWPAKKELITIENGGININFEYFRFGKYIATAKIGHDVNNQRIVSERAVEFWILPWYLILAILIGFSLIVGLIVMRMRKQNGKKTTKKR